MANHKVNYKKEMKKSTVSNSAEVRFLFDNDIGKCCTLTKQVVHAFEHTTEELIIVDCVLLHDNFVIVFSLNYYLEILDSDANVYEKLNLKDGKLPLIMLVKKIKKDSKKAKMDELYHVIGKLSIKKSSKYYNCPQLSDHLRNGSDIGDDDCFEVTRAVINALNEQIVTDYLKSWYVPKYIVGTSLGYNAGHFSDKNWRGVTQ